MLHTWWCIAFEYLNSNLCLNSFVWLFFKKLKPLFLSFSFSSPFLARFVWSPNRRSLLRHPQLRSGAAHVPLSLTCFVSLSPSFEVLLCPLVFPAWFACTVAAQPSAASDPPQPMCALAARSRWHAGPACHHPPPAVLDPDSGASPYPPRVRLPRRGPHAKRAPRPYSKRSLPPRNPTPWSLAAPSSHAAPTANPSCRRASIRLTVAFKN
jgi:hypothetical protein